MSDEPLHVQYERRLRDALDALPPCPNDCIRLYRSALEGDLEYRAAHMQAGREFINASGLIHHPGLYYTSTLQNTLMYLPREHTQDEPMDKKLVLSYVDVPISEVRPCSKINMYRYKQSNGYKELNSEFLLTDALISTQKPIAWFSREEATSLTKAEWSVVGRELDYRYNMPGRLGEVEIHHGEEMVARLRMRKEMDAKPPGKH